MCLIVFGVVIGAAFLLNEAKVAKYPVMPLRLFKNKANVVALLVAFLHDWFVLPDFTLALSFGVDHTADLLRCLILHASICPNCTGLWPSPV